MMAQTIPDLMRGIGRAARAAATVLATAPADQKNHALRAAAAALRSRRALLLAANESDVRLAAQAEMSRALLDRHLNIQSAQGVRGFDTVNVRKMKNGLATPAWR